MDVRQLDAEQWADNSSRAFCVFRLLIIFTALSYFGTWIYALSVQDITSWKTLNFHIIMLGIVVALLGFYCFYEWRFVHSSFIFKNLGVEPPSEHN
ncbi:hypothetical protein AVEN_190721-1 [Araneus ventricosus]|uniref:Uncharacterized protein n=1 Tax=Araneus ventricosus TaxID=182803 RepID=A0A4Y2KVP3_ARAVE|nr:hypothetical protein AVEN_190721-1 [Araneus ventricosus]